MKKNRNRKNPGGTDENTGNTGKSGTDGSGHGMTNGTGTLYVVPTPIGNLEDITLRALRVLKEVDEIAAEDTRNTLKLLNHFQIKKPLTSYHEHNEREKSGQLMEKLRRGNSIALVSDAGMPGISDPGHHLIGKVIEEGFPIEILPGASALINALVGSGLSTKAFLFQGFLPRDKKNRKEILEELKTEMRTLVFYESPHRIKESLGEMEKIFGDRQAVIARELTKKFEEFLRGSFSELLEVLKGGPLKGEMVLVVEGAEKQKETSYEGLTIEEHLLLVMKTGVSKKEAIKQVAGERKIPKREVYDVTIRESLD